MGNTSVVLMSISTTGGPRPRSNIRGPVHLEGTIWGGGLTRVFIPLRHTSNFFYFFLIFRVNTCNQLILSRLFINSGNINKKEYSFITI